jgi:hypothetical protein
MEKKMATISISDLNFSSEHAFFSDSESFLDDISDQELASTVGGITPVFTVTAAWGTVSVWGVGFGTGFAAGSLAGGAGLGYWAMSRK